MAHLVWQQGGTADILSLSEGAITLRSTIPSPPGSRIEGALAGGEARLKVKIHGSKRQDDGTYVLTGRPIDLTKEVRERLVAALASAG